MSVEASATGEIPWMLLFKFGQREHLQDFRDGILHMSSQTFFANLENDAARSDRYEGTDRIHQPQEIKQITFTDHVRGTEIVLTPENLRGPVSIFFGRRSYNLFCMYGLTPPFDVGHPTIDARNLMFGKSFVSIIDPQEFISRVYYGAKNAGLRGGCKMVEYYNETEHSGDTGPFRKPSAFSHQREFRIAVYPGSSDPIRLHIGSLADITTAILPLADFSRLVEFRSVPIG
jgi:hypothetical protein